MIMHPRGAFGDVQRRRDLPVQPAEGRETTETGIEVFWRWLPGKDANGVRWLIVLNPGEEAAQVPEWARDLVGSGSALVLCPRGVGPVAHRCREETDASDRRECEGSQSRVGGCCEVACRHRP